MTTAPTLRTDRLTLRHHRLDDFDAYAALWARDEAKFMGGPLDRDGASINVATRLGAVLDTTAERPAPEDLVYRHKKKGMQ